MSPPTKPYGKSKKVKWVEPENDSDSPMEIESYHDKLDEVSESSAWESSSESETGDHHWTISTVTGPLAKHVADFEETGWESTSTSD